MKLIILAILGVLMLLPANVVSGEKKNQKESETVWKEYGWLAAKTVGISAAVIGGTTVVVPALGFTAGGVAAGSVAAWAQSTFLGGTVASGGLFAGMQSIGAAGLAASTKVAIGSISAVAVGVSEVLSKKDASDVSSSSEETAESEKIKLDDELSKIAGHKDFESLYNELLKRFYQSTPGSEEEKHIRKKLKMLTLMKEINKDPDNEEL